jgi:hypothetical protein
MFEDISFAKHGDAAIASEMVEVRSTCGTAASHILRRTPTIRVGHKLCCDKQKDHVIFVQTSFDFIIYLLSSAIINNFIVFGRLLKKSNLDHKMEGLDL